MRLLAMFLVVMGLAIAPQGHAETSPGQVYLAYQKALAQATDFEGVLPLFAKSAQERLAKKAVTPELRSQMFAALRLLLLTDVKVVNETIKGTEATVVAEGNGTGVKETDQGRSHRTRATATLVKEDGRWKMVKETQKLL